MVAFGRSHYIKLQKSSDVKNSDPSDNYLSLPLILHSPLVFCSKGKKKITKQQLEAGVSSHLNEVFCCSSLLLQFMWAIVTYTICYLTSDYFITWIPWFSDPMISMKCKILFNNLKMLASGKKIGNEENVRKSFA